MKSLKKVSVVLVVVMALTAVTGCNLTEPVDNLDSEGIIAADIQQELKKEKPTEQTKWNGVSHRGLAEFGCKAIGIENSTFWTRADDPDSFKGGDDEGYSSGLLPGDYPGKPGHAKFYTYDGGWKARAPYTAKIYYGPQKWADDNVKKWMNTARSHFNSNTNNHDIYLGYVLHYIADMGVPYHVYWGNNITSAWRQWQSHDNYESAVQNNWTSGKNFLSLLGGGTYWDEMYNATSAENLVRKLALYNAKNFGARVVDTIKSGSVNFNNSNVFNGTHMSLEMAHCGVTTTLMWAARNFGVLRSKNKTYGVLNSNGKQISVNVYAVAGDKIYCGASWRKKYGGDMDLKIYRLSDNRQMSSSYSSTDDPETLSYVVPTTGNYKIVAYAYRAGSQVGLNAVVIKKKNGKYIFD